MEKMKIKILQSFSGVVPPDVMPTGFRKNQVVEVPSLVAEEWIRIGYAVAENPVDEEVKPEKKKPSTKKKETTE